MYDAIAVALDFPSYFGRNFDALNDCLSDVASGSYGTPEDATGLVLVLTGYDSFASKEPMMAHSVADIFASQSRQAMLYGQRMLCLLQSDDPRFTLPPVGAQTVAWNEAEWLDSKRGI